MTNNEITCIAENKNGYLFIGTKKGINILDKRTYQIIPVTHNDLKDQEIRTMIVDSDGWVWVGTLTSVFVVLLISHIAKDMILLCLLLV